MNILPIDFDLSDYELSKWHDKWSVEKFGEGVLDPCRYYQVSKDGLYLYTDSVAEGEALNEEKAIRDYVLELLVRIRAINRKLKGVGIKKHLTYQEREELKKNREALYNEFKGLNSGQTTDAQSLNPEPQQAQPKQETTASTIPTINDTEKEKSVFEKALQKQYMSLNNGSYKWTLKKSLLAYMCGRLYCGDRIKEDNSDYRQIYIKGNTQMPAQEVKALFGVDVASNRYSLKTPPRNSWKVDELFKRNGASK